MRTTLFHLLLFLALGSLKAQQIPNAGFENWSPCNFNPPSNMCPDEYYMVSNICSPVLGNTGNYAIFLSPYVEGLGGRAYLKFPLISRPAKLSFYYKSKIAYSQVAQMYDWCWVDLDIYFQGTRIGGGGFTTNTDESNFKYESFSITYTSPQVPDSASIIIYGGADIGGSFLGTEFIVDDFAFEGTASVEKSGFLSSDLEIFPNPSSSNVNLSFYLESPKRLYLQVYDILGNMVKQVWENEERMAGKQMATIEITDLPSGVYYLKMRSSEGSECVKPVYVIGK